MVENNEINKHPKYGNGVSNNRRDNGRRRKKVELQRLLYSYKNQSRCSRMSGVWKREGRLVWYSYHNKWFRKYSNRVIRGKPMLEIPSGGWYRKIFDYSCVCW